MISEMERRTIDSLQSFRWLQDLTRNTRDVAQIDPYVYAVTVGPVAVGASASASTPIENDSDFYLVNMTASWVNQLSRGVVLSEQNVFVQVADAATNRNLYQEPVPVILAYGTTASLGLPFYNPAPRIFAANSRINVMASFTTAAAATSITLQLCFIGAKVSFKRGDSHAP